MATYYKENDQKMALLVSGDDDFDLSHPYLTHTLQSNDVDEIYSFLQKNCTTAGLSIQYGISSDGQAYEFIRKGKMGKRQIKEWIERAGIVEWHYSWAWATHYFYVKSLGRKVKTIECDLSPVETMKTAVQYKSLFGY